MVIHESVYCIGTQHRHQSTEERQSTRSGWHPNGADKAVWTQGRRLCTSVFNNCTETKTIPKIWRQAKVVALLKPGKDPSVAKSFRPITLLCHTYKLFERFMLNRIAENVDAKLIQNKPDFVRENHVRASY